MSVSAADVFRFIADPRNKLAVLGSTASTGPQTALVGIAVTSDLALIFDTVKSSRKYPNLAADARCSFVIGLGGRGGITVQYQGEVREVTGAAELDRLKQIYFAVFADGPSRESWPGIAYFMVKPAWIRYNDYGGTPPVIEEFTF